MNNIKTPECQEYSNASNSENIQNITHADFVVGMQNATIGCLLGEPYKLCGGPRKTIFNILWLLYTASPLIIIPLWSYHVGNWWLLIGIGISYVATLSAGQYSRNVLLFGCYCIGFWMHNGFRIYHYTTFYFFCALWGYMLWQLANTVRIGCARQSLIESPKLYNEAIAENRIRIVRLDSSQHMILTPEDITASLTGRGMEQLELHVTFLVISNIIAEAFTYVFGLFTGLTGAVRAHAKGIKNLTPGEADSIMRQLKNGTMGLAVLTLGYFGVYSIYGFLFAACYVVLVLLVVSKQRKKEI